MTIESKRSNRTLYAALACLAAICIGGIIGINTLTRLEEQRDFEAWETTLNVMADSRTKLIQHWVNTEFTELKELAANGSLQVYSQQLSAHRATESEIEPAQLSYLRNLILDAAQRYGFVATAAATQEIPANVPFLADAGLTLVTKEMQVLCATPGMPQPSDALQQTIKTVIASGETAIQDIALDDQGRPVLSFLVPVFSALPQGEAPADKAPIAVLVGTKNAAKTLFPLIASATGTKTAEETLLLRRDGNLITYVSPLADGTPPLAKNLSADGDTTVSAQAVREPGKFVQGTDYNGAMVLAVSRTLPGLPWILLQTIGAEEELAESREHQRFLYLVLLLALSLAASLVVAAWFYGGKVKEQQEAERIRAQARQLAAQAHLLTAINDHIHDSLFLVRAGGEVIFINRACAKLLNIPADHAEGKTLGSALGKISAEQLMALAEKALESGKPVIQEMTVELNRQTVQCHATFVAFPYSGGENDTVLITLHDITQLNEARAKKERLLTHTVQALMRAIDLHDPYSANHSANTTFVAMAIGRRMDLPYSWLQVLEFAAGLCNIGKLSIPKEVLAKTGPLTEAEQAMLRRETEFAKQMLAGIEFEGPVLETILQKNEHVDGSGHPVGLRGDSIQLTARVLAVANAFVAMISPRAYRDTLTTKETMENLYAAADSRFDRQVVAALFHVAENEIDWSVWPKRGS